MKMEYFRAFLIPPSPPPSFCSQAPDSKYSIYTPRLQGSKAPRLQALCDPRNSPDLDSPGWRTCIMHISMHIIYIPKCCMYM